MQCLNPHDTNTQRIYDADGIYPAIPANSNGGQNRQAICFQQNQREEVRDMGDKTGSIAANGGAHQTNYVCAFMGGQGDRARSIAWTEEATPPLKAVPSGSNTVPDICYPIMFKERAGCPGGGKGILCGDKPFTLSTLTDQAVCYPINTMVATRWKADDGRTTFGIGDNGDPQFTIGAAHEHAVCYAVRTAQTNANGVGVAQEAHTLDGANGQAVCYQNKVGALCADDYKGTNQQYVDQDKVVVHVMERPLDCMHDQQIVLYTKQAIGHYCELKVASTQQARQYKSADDLVVSSAKPLRKYIIRRLTPLECCRLQGFPDCWCSDIGIENPTEDDIAFWTEVWETHRRVMGVSKKPKSRRKIIKWLKDPYSDSAEYKMWGNGLALPNAAYAVGCAVRLIGEARVQDE